MEIFEKRDGDKFFWSVTGKLDTITSNVLREKFDQVKDTVRYLALDLSEVKYISSAGLRVLLIIMKGIKAAGGKFSIAKISDAVRDVFSVAGFLGIIMQEEQSVILVKEKNGASATLTLAGLMGLKEGMALNSKLEELENAGFTHFFLEMANTKTKTPEFLAVLREIQRRISQKGKLTCYFS
ncbi:MAG: STAS domain-containing protein [Treponema sp.]|jgi:anti-anti-sigma factor|nr:STAS domain-containing protein [Treponema sp.]